MTVLHQKLAQRGAERDQAQADLKRATKVRRFYANDIDEIIKHVGGITSALNTATPEERAELYPSLGPRLTYDPTPHQVNVDVDLARVAWACRRGDLDHNPTVVLRTALDLR